AALGAIISTIPLFLVQGPPGVGKTRLVRDLVLDTLADNSSARLLLTAQSNAAVNHLMDELAKALEGHPGEPVIVRSQSKDNKDDAGDFEISRQTESLIAKLTASPLVAEAPQADDHMTPAAKAFFAQVLEGLDALGIAYVRNPRLVRGLDYYCHTVFEFTTQLLGAQNAVLSGGRYDGLIGTMGGPETPGIGWAAGMERLLDLSPYQASVIPPVAVIAGTEALRQKALVVARNLRYQGVVTEVLHGGNLGKALKKADKLGAIHAVILGEDECSRGNVAVKHMPSGEQKEIPESEILSHVTQQTR
ncbi:MAG: ATP phosphoribosyltransferase regulatory subunit, partial [Alphaproteobacteria bacterium]|nr:ATP phosphoribosyltransferase regulatory subunit [Alphaproteobacteria bacterium]